MITRQTLLVLIACAALLGVGGKRGRQLPVDAEMTPCGKLDPLPRDFELRTRCEALFRSDSPATKELLRPEDIQKILDLGTASGYAFDKSPSHYVACTLAMDEFLAKLPADFVTPLRDAQNKAALRHVEDLRPAGDTAAIAGLARRYPYAACVHELLLESAERDLRRGRTAPAAAALNDVLVHAPPGALRDNAQAAAWLAMAQEDTPQARVALEEQLAAAAGPPMTWRGRSAAPQDILKELLAGLPPRAPRAMASLPRKSLRLPASWPSEQRKGDGPLLDSMLHAPWPVMGIASMAGAPVLAGRGVIARWRDDGAGPAWTRPTCIEDKTWDPLAAARFLRSNPAPDLTIRPVVTSLAVPASPDAKAMYCLTSQPPAIAAVEAATGNTLWSTDQRPDWKDMTPMSHPAICEGRLYVLAVPVNLTGDAGPGPLKEAGPPVLWHLACLDARDGRMIWKQPLAWQPYTLLDLARATPPVTISQGSVYCNTNMGVIARCDIRDGALLWLRGYACTVSADILSPNFSREGSSPIVAGKTVMVAPRDCSGILAFHRDSGQELWDSDEPSQRLVAASGGVLIAAADQGLAGVEIATGKTLWKRSFPAGGATRATVASDEVLVMDGSPATANLQMHRIAAASGKDIEQAALPGAGADEILLLRDGTLAELHLAPAMDPATAMASRPAGQPGNVYEEIMLLPMARPEIVWPTVPGEGQFVVWCGRRLARIAAGPNWNVAWQRVLPRQLGRVALQGNLVVAAAGSSLTAFSAADGSVKWCVNLPFVPGAVGSNGDISFAAGAGAAACVDAAGKLLWSGRPPEGSRVQGPPAHATLKGAGQQVSLHVIFPAASFPDSGMFPAEMVLDARTGRLREFRRFLPQEPGWPPHIVFDGETIRWVGRDGRAHVTSPAGDHDAAAKWRRGANLQGYPQHPSFAFGISTAPSGLYLRSISQLAHYDLSGDKEMLYNLPRNRLPRRTRVEQPPTNLIFDLREEGNLLLVLSGTTTAAYEDWGKYWRDVFNPNWARMFVDVFDRTTGAHQGRQQLGDLPYCTFGSDGMDTQARFVGETVVVTAPDGVHVFKPKAGGAKIDNPPPPPPLPPKEPIKPRAAPAKRPKNRLAH
ncbi:MAG: PQQ-like beta-propeller repeat protein [Planctomycetaceae bacterium]|nr:PQQ-like beta-propeller repeat protein [Planctomycetaceae bacterium]